MCVSFVFCFFSLSWPWVENRHWEWISNQHHHQMQLPRRASCAAVRCVAVGGCLCKTMVRHCNAIKSSGNRNRASVGEPRLALRLFRAKRCSQWFLEMHWFVQKWGLFSKNAKSFRAPFRAALFARNGVSLKALKTLIPLHHPASARSPAGRPPCSLRRLAAVIQCTGLDDGGEISLPPEDGQQTQHFDARSKIEWRPKLF